MPIKSLIRIQDTNCHHDFEGNRIFQHRNRAKWNLFDGNKRIEGFQYEEECLEFLTKLQDVWDGVPRTIRFNFENSLEPLRQIAARLIDRTWNYLRVGHDCRSMVFLINGTIGEGAAGCEVFWNLKQENDGVFLQISSRAKATCRLVEDRDGVWKGRWLHHEKMPIELSPRNDCERLSY